MSDGPIIVIRDLVKRFETQVVLDKLDLEVARGEITVILGKSGTGKSVLLKCIVGLYKPDSGSITVDGEAPDLRLYETCSRLSYLFQGNALFDSLSVFDNIAMPLVERKGGRRRNPRARVISLIEQLDLDRSILRKYPSQLSGGMQKRVALARALITEPQIVLFDEPTAGLDPIRRRDVFDMIQRYHGRFGFTAVVVTHDVEEAGRVAHHYALLDRGTITRAGPISEIVNQGYSLLYEMAASPETLPPFRL